MCGCSFVIITVISTVKTERGVEKFLCSYKFNEPLIVHNKISLSLDNRREWRSDKVNRNLQWQFRAGREELNLKMRGSTSEMQKSVGLVGEAFIENGGTELVFKPMRFWFVERKRDGIPSKRKHS